LALIYGKSNLEPSLIVLITDDVETAKQIRDDILKGAEAEKKMKESQDEEEKKKSESEQPKKEDDDDEEEDDKEDGHDEL